jgi:hypothetical protein
MGCPYNKSWCPAAGPCSGCMWAEIEAGRKASSDAKSVPLTHTQAEAASVVHKQSRVLKTGGEVAFEFASIVTDDDTRFADLDLLFADLGTFATATNGVTYSSDLRGWPASLGWIVVPADRSVRPRRWYMTLHDVKAWVAARKRSRT